MAQPALAEDEPLPPEWREHFADLAAEWLRRKGTPPTSFEALAAFGDQDSGIAVEDELAYLEGRRE